MGSHRERGRERERAPIYCILITKEATVLVEASVTTATQLSIVWEHRSQNILHYQIKELMYTPISFCEIVRLFIQCGRTTCE